MLRELVAQGIKQLSLQLCCSSGVLFRREGSDSGEVEVTVDGSAADLEASCYLRFAELIFLNGGDDAFS